MYKTVCGIFLFQNVDTSLLDGKVRLANQCSEPRECERPNGSVYLVGVVRQRCNLTVPQVLMCHPTFYHRQSIKHNNKGKMFSGHLLIDSQAAEGCIYTGIRRPFVFCFFSNPRWRFMRVVVLAVMSGLVWKWKVSCPTRTGVGKP